MKSIFDLLQPCQNSGFHILANQFLPFQTLHHHDQNQRAVSVTLSCVESAEMLQHPPCSRRHITSPFNPFMHSAHYSGQRYVFLLLATVPMLCISSLWSLYLCFLFMLIVFSCIHTCFLSPCCLSLASLLCVSSLCSLRFSCVWSC